MTENAAMVEHYRRFLDGDERALGDIVRSYSDSMMLFTVSLVKNIRDAEEIVSDAFVQIAVKKHAFRGDAQLKTYLFAICRNRAADMLREKARCPTQTELEPDILADHETLEGRILRTERDEQLHRAIGQLNEEYRTALYLVYFESMSHADTARIMKKSLSQTENIIFRARKALAAILTKEGFTYEDIR